MKIKQNKRLMAQHFRNIHLVLILSLVMLLFGLRPIQAQTSADSGPVSSEYKLGGGDGVKITVFLNPELAVEARVSEQGQINFPLVGLVKIGGLSVTEAEKLISDQLREGGYVQRAQVLLSITAYRSQLVSVLGNVVRPGRYPLEIPGTKLTDLLAMAGGVAIGGSDTVILTRSGSLNVPKKIEIDLPGIFLEGKNEFDLVLQAGDSIYVHKQPNFFISGSVGRPGIYNVDRGLTIAQAIAKGGSYTLRSRESGVRLLRRDASGNIVERTPSKDEPILPDDHIFVRESLF
jgi:polysaccharide biosynthesis/export protein